MMMIQEILPLMTLLMTSVYGGFIKATSVENFWTTSFYSWAYIQLNTGLTSRDTLATWWSGDPSVVTLNFISILGISLTGNYVQR